MRSIRTLTLAVAGLVLLASPGSAQRSDGRFQWYLGAQGGVFGFETPSQTRGFIPSAGGHLLVVAKRTGLLVSVDEAFGSSETSGFLDPTVASGIRDVRFDHVRRYSAILTGYPLRGATQPYFGFGFGISQVIDPQPQGVFGSPALASDAKFEADRKSTDGFMSFVAGLQFRMSGAMLFAQYQLSSSAGSGKLLHGAGHGISGGIRFSMGPAKEGIHGGGY